MCLIVKKGTREQDQFKSARKRIFILWMQIDWKFRTGYLIGSKEFTKCKWRRRAVTIGIIIVKCHTNLIQVVCAKESWSVNQSIN